MTNRKCIECGLEFTPANPLMRVCSDKCKHARHKSAMRRWQQKNSEKVKAASRQWRKNNPEMVRKAALSWQKDNPEKVREMRLRWYQANKDRINARRRTKRRSRDQL